jgi:nucleotide-binding universal stress UspA family protein
VRSDDLQIDVQVRVARAPGDEVLAAVSDVKAQLLVIGSRSHNLVSRMFLGSVARDVVRKTHVPLLLEWFEPNGDSTALHRIDGCVGTLRHVLLATDLSKHAAAAQDAALVLAGRAMQIDCLSVVTPQAKDATPAWPLMVRAALNDLATTIEALGSRCEVLVLEGDPHDTIARVAAERDCSLIVVGKRGEHWVKSVVIGSTALRLCETAGRPVLLVPLAAG